MSLLKKLKNKKKEMPKAKFSKGEINRIVANEKANEKDLRRKPRFTNEESEMLKAQEVNGVFRLSNASYILLQRYATALDDLFALRDKVGTTATTNDALKIYYLENIIEAIMQGDGHIRKHHIVVEDDVCEMDNAHHMYHEIINRMDKMNERSLDILFKAADIITTEKRYMWLESESDFHNNTQLAIQYGIELASKNRKNATLKDVEAFLDKNKK